MSERFLFFNSATGDPRKYQAQDFAQYFSRVLSTGLLHTNNSPGMKVKVEPGTLNSIVDPGESIMRGHYYENTTPLSLAHALPETDLNRIDRIILRLNLSNAERNIHLRVLTGDPAAEPVAPALVRTAFIYDISLAKILVQANTVQLQQSNLTDERLDEDVCGTVSSLITVPTNVFNQQFQEWISQNQEGFNSWFTVNQEYFTTWFESIKGLLNSEVAGNLLLLIQKNEADIKSLIKIKTNVTVLTNGWVLNDLTNRYEYTISDTDIRDSSVVDINIQIDYLDEAKTLLSVCNSGLGLVTLYASSPPDSDLIVDYRITKEVV